MKKTILALLILCTPTIALSEILTMVRDPTTYEFVLDTINHPVTRSTISSAAVLLPEAAAAVGVTVSSSITLPLSAAILGTAWLTQDLYNKQKIEREWYNPPLYAEMSSVPSPQDFICQPAHISMDIQAVTADTFPSVADITIGRPCYVSTPLGEFIDFINESTDPVFQPIRDIVNANSNPGGVDGSNLPYSIAGKVYTANNGQNVLISNATWSTGMDPNYITTQMATRTPRFAFGAGGGCWSTTGTISGEWQCGNYSSWNGTWLSHIWAFNGSVTTLPAVPASPKTYNYANLRDQLKTLLQSNPDSITNALKDIAPKNISITDKVPSQSDAKPLTQTGPISQQELNNFYTSNATNVANYNTTNITSTTTPAEIAKGNAAVEAAKAAADNLPSSATFSGDADLPNLPSYDTTIIQPVEISFVDRVYAFLNSGLPVLGSIRSSGLTSSGSPTMSCDLWGHHIQVDFSGQQGVLRSAGILLVSLATLYSFLIIVRS